MSTAKELYKTDPLVRGILDLKASRPRVYAQTMTAKQAATALGEPYWHVMKAMQRLGATEAGDFLVGRVGRATRIEWSPEFDVTTLEQAAPAGGDLVAPSAISALIAGHQAEIARLIGVNVDQVQVAITW